MKNIKGLLIIITVIVMIFIGCNKTDHNKTLPVQNHNAPPAIDTVYCCYTDVIDTAGVHTITYLSCEPNNPGGFNANIGYCYVKYSQVPYLVISVKSSCSVCPH